MFCMLIFPMLLGASEVSLSIADAKPQLVFAADDLGILRQRVKNGEFRKLWKRIRDAAEEYSDPHSDKYADPEKADQPPRTTPGR